MGVLIILGKSPVVSFGEHVQKSMRITWNKMNAKEVAFAKKVFNEHLCKGWFAVSKTSSKTTQIFTFNPELEKIVLTPLIAGG